MKIGPEHIGKKVTSDPNDSDYYCILLAIHDDHVWVKDSTGVIFTAPRDNDWELVEEPKRPSERIAEILRDYASPSLHVADREAIEAVIDYLDEQWEKK